MSRIRHLAPAALAGLALVVAPLAVAPAHAVPATHLIINEVYGGGGNSGATYANDFVELYNPTESAIDLSGYKITYYSAAGNAGGSCALVGSVPANSYYLAEQAKGTGGTTPLPSPDATCALALSATQGSVSLTSAAGVTLDLVGYGSVAKFETNPTGATTNTTSVSRTGFADTDDNSADFTRGAPSPVSKGTTPPPDPGQITLPIAEIQGTGNTSPHAEQQVVTTGVVTAVYPTGGFNGFYMQTPGTGGTAKPPGTASDGIFVYGITSVEIGSCYTVAGTAKEYNGLTELDRVTVTAASGCAPVQPTPLASLPATDRDKEPYEGMLVQPVGRYTITNNYQLNQYGQIGLAVGTRPLYTATEKVAPGTAATAYEATNQLKYITLDDGSSWDYVRNATAQRSPLPYLSQATPMRTGSHVRFTEPVILDYCFQWNYQPTGQVVGPTTNVPVSSKNDRPATVPNVGGNIKLSSFNVLNYFTDLGMNETGCAAYKDMHGNPVTTNYCQVRGAWSASAFADQEAKIVKAITGLGADIVGLAEIENSAGISYLPGQPRDKALAHLVAALNRAGGNWAYVPSPRVVPTTEDVIRTAFIYNPARVQLLGPSVIDIDPAFANARYPLAQKFKQRRTGKPFVAVMNHFKSKGSGEDDGTGQGLANPAREAQARQLTAWVTDRFAGEAVFLMGDFNAYSAETPVGIIEAAGYTNVMQKYAPAASTYQYSGRLGSLDHIFANAKAMKLVTGAAVWDINADESIAMQYSRRNYNITDFFTPGPFASSDHDPTIVGIRTGKK